MRARGVAARRGRGVGNGAQAPARARGRALRDAMSGRYSFWCPDNAHARHLAGVTDSDKDFLRETKRVENPLERMAAKAAAAPARKWTPPAGWEPPQPLIPARPPDSARRRPATARARSCASERAGAEEGNVDDERSGACTL